MSHTPLRDRRRVRYLAAALLLGGGMGLLVYASPIVARLTWVQALLRLAATVDFSTVVLISMPLLALPIVVLSIRHRDASGGRGYSSSSDHSFDAGVTGGAEHLGD